MWMAHWASTGRSPRPRPKSIFVRARPKLLAVGNIPPARMALIDTAVSGSRPWGAAPPALVGTDNSFSAIRNPRNLVSGKTLRRRRFGRRLDPRGLGLPLPGRDQLHLLRGPP